MSRGAFSVSTEITEAPLYAAARGCQVQGCRRGALLGLARFTSAISGRPGIDSAA